MIIKQANSPHHEFEKALVKGFFNRDPKSNDFSENYVYNHTEIYEDGKIRNFFKNKISRELVSMEVDECT